MTELEYETWIWERKLLAMALAKCYWFNMQAFVEETMEKGFWSNSRPSAKADPKVSPLTRTRNRWAKVQQNEVGKRSGENLQPKMLMSTWMQHTTKTTELQVLGSKASKQNLMFALGPTAAKLLAIKKGYSLCKTQSFRKIKLYTG